MRRQPLDLVDDLREVCRAERVVEALDEVEVGGVPLENGEVVGGCPDTVRGEADEPLRQHRPGRVCLTGCPMAVGGTPQGDDPARLANGRPVAGQLVGR